MQLDHNPLTEVILPVLASSLAATMRFLMLPHERTLWTYMRALFVAGGASFFAYGIMVDNGVSSDTAPFYCGVIAFVADDLLRGLLTFGKKLREDPVGTIRELLGLKK